ncbi:hypothetical protein BGW42_008268 [Actinomortierella wolfii]|nr:hypothetical protein BGW42_008268 [Actinomortierella wolfii]
MKALDLPEIRFRVCCFLDDADLARVALVSSGWYFASRQLLWYHPKLRGRTSREIRSLLASPPQPTEGDQAIPSSLPLYPVGPQVKSLGFLGAKLANPRKDILFCVEQCPNIVSLDLTGQPHRLRLVARIVERRPGIRRIRLRGYPSPPSTKRPLPIDDDAGPLGVSVTGAGAGGNAAGLTDDDGGAWMDHDNPTGTMATTSSYHQHPPTKKRRRERKSEEEVFEILKRLRSLQTLSLWTLSVTVDQIASFAQQARQSLVSLHLFPAKGIPDDVLLAIGANFPHLEVLSLAIESSAPFRDIEVGNHIHGNGGTITPTLTPDGLFSLSAASSPLLPPPPSPTTADGLVRFFKECLTESLQTVSLPRCRMTDEAIRVLVARNKNLKTLQVPSCPLLTAHGLRHILDHAEQLVTLDFSKIRLFKWASLPSASQQALEEQLGVYVGQASEGSGAGGAGASEISSMTEQDLREETLKVIFGLPFWTGCSQLQTLDLSSHCFFIQPPPSSSQRRRTQQHDLLQGDGGVAPPPPTPPLLNTAFFASPTSSFGLCAWPGPAASEEVSQWIFAQFQQLTRLRDLRLDMIPWFPTVPEIERFATLPRLEFLNLGAIEGLEDPRLVDGDLHGLGDSADGELSAGNMGDRPLRRRLRRRRRSIWGQHQVPPQHHHNLQTHEPPTLDATAHDNIDILAGHPPPPSSTAPSQSTGNTFLGQTTIEEEREDDLEDEEEEALQEDDDEEEEEEVDEEIEMAARERALAMSKQVVDKFLEALPRLKVLEMPYRPQAVRSQAFQAYLQQQRPGFRF